MALPVGTSIQRLVSEASFPLLRTALKGHPSLELPAELAEASVQTVSWQLDFCLCAIPTLSAPRSFPRRCGCREHSLTNVCTSSPPQLASQMTPPGLPAFFHFTGLLPQWLSSIKGEVGLDEPNLVSAYLENLRRSDFHFCLSHLLET